MDRKGCQYLLLKIYVRKKCPNIFSTHFKISCLYTISKVLLFPPNTLIKIRWLYKYLKIVCCVLIQLLCQTLWFFIKNVLSKFIKTDSNSLISLKGQWLVECRKWQEDKINLRKLIRNMDREDTDKNSDKSTCVPKSGNFCFIFRFLTGYMMCWLSWTWKPPTICN